MRTPLGKGRSARRKSAATKTQGGGGLQGKKEEDLEKKITSFSRATGPGRPQLERSPAKRLGRSRGTPEKEGPEVEKDRNEKKRFPN